LRENTTKKELEDNIDKDAELRIALKYVFIRLMIKFLFTQREIKSN